MSTTKIVIDRPILSLRPSDPCWPSTVNALKRKPAGLRVAGTLPQGWAVAVVGTRFADADALAFAQQLGGALAALGACVVSGGAAGIDAAAHQGALDAGGLSVAVLATGLVEAYPPQHGPLFSAIARQGALVVEDLPVHRGKSWAFLRRNELIAALADCVVVVQAPLRSGALSTARYAKLLKKQVFVVPAAPWDPRGAGCLRLLSAGARICTSATDVLSVRPSAFWPPQLPGLSAVSDDTVTDTVTDTARHNLESKNDEDLRQSAPVVPRPLSACTLELLECGPAHPDELARRLDTQAARVQEALLTLTLAGLVKRAADGTYFRTPD